MNQIQLIQQRNKIKRLVRTSNRKPNGLYWSSIESDAHILMKLEICKYLKNQGKEFMTEAIFENGSRCDVLCLDNGICYEITDSESKESIIEKQAKYPLEIRVINANQPFNEKLMQ